MEGPDWAPADVDLSRPSVARVYDHWLGGAHNFAIDREMSQQILAVAPQFRMIARHNRAFLFRAVRFMIDAGIGQFLDLGSGIPTVGNVHEVAQRVAPQSRTLYVDIDPVAVTHSRQILAGNDRAGAIQADVRRPESILAAPETGALLDLDQPVGLLMVAVLHYVPDEDDPYGVVARLRDALCPGSYLAIAHATLDEQSAEMHQVQQMSRRTATPATARTREQVARFFTGFELVEPGLVWAPQWRPESPEEAADHPQRSSNYAGVGRR